MSKLIALLVFACALASAFGADRSLSQTGSLVATASTASLPSVCTKTTSKFDSSIQGKTFRAILNGSNSVPQPIPTPSTGIYEVVVDEKNQIASWTLKLCDNKQYFAAHLHDGSPKSDYPPPLIPLEPYVKPAKDFGPPSLLPQFCPPIDVKGCTYMAKGSFNKGDILPLPGRPQDKGETPAVLNFGDFVKALKSGKIYANVHTKAAPGGLIRGNLQQQR